MRRMRSAALLPVKRVEVGTPVMSAGLACCNRAVVATFMLATFEARCRPSTFISFAYCVRYAMLRVVFVEGDEFRRLNCLIASSSCSG